MVSIRHKIINVALNQIVPKIYIFQDVCTVHVHFTLTYTKLKMSITYLVLKFLLFKYNSIEFLYTLNTYILHHATETVLY